MVLAMMKYIFPSSFHRVHTFFGKAMIPLGFEPKLNIFQKIKNCVQHRNI
jgi:hypothetical protein